MMDFKELCKEALAKWGAEAQLDQTIEECAELIQAIQKHRRRGEIRNLIEEAVDVEIMIDQLKTMFPLTETWTAIKKEKRAYLRGLLGK